MSTNSLLNKKYPEDITFIREKIEGTFTHRVLISDGTFIEHFDSHRHILIKSRSKNDPETSKEAKQWLTVRNHYLDDGLCYTCAAQAAWGHSNGFTLVWPPCLECSKVIQSFPIKENNGWRRWPRGDRRDASPLAQNEPPGPS